MQLTSLSLALTRAGFLSFSPASLFAAGEPGVWYEPSLTNGTCFQDAAGTTPVTAVEQPVGLMLDKSKGLVLGPELVTNGDFATDTAWTKETGWSISGGTAVASGVNSFAAIYQSASVVAGRMYLVTFTVSNYSAGQVYAYAGSGGFGVARSANGTYTQYIFASGTALIALRGTNGFIGSIDNISVRELPGNHATQTTATSRPVLSARYNLLTKTEQFDDAAWVKQSGLISISANVAVAPDGTTTADMATWTGNASLFQSLVGTIGTTYTASISIKGTAGQTISVWLDAGSALDRKRITLTGEWQRIVCTATQASFTGLNFAVRKDSASDTADSVFVWGASIVPANQASLPYQRVNTATDYDADPSKFKPYLRFDGVDDWLVTPTITPGTDKAQVFAGVRKLSDAATGMAAEYGVGGINTNQWQMAAPRTAGANYGFVSSGNLTANATSASIFAAPITNVLSGTGDVSGDSAILRVNGAQAAISTLDQGTGNYLAYPLYIGRRNGTTLPFNGHIYGLIVRFGSTLPTATIASTETWLNQRTGAY